MRAAGAIIEVEGASVALGGTWIFRGLSFDLARGQTLGILGRNGRGKTTLLRALLGLQALSEGHTRVRGSVGYVSQCGIGTLAYSVLDVVLMGRARHIGIFAVPGRADRAAARAALKTVGIEDFAARPINHLSGGEQQLVLIARALASECGVLILDEPTSNLDYHNQNLILSTIRYVARDCGLAVVLSSHYPQHALHVCDKVLLMHGVDDHEVGPPDSVMTELALARLYGIPIHRVEWERDNQSITSLVPVFS